MTAAEDREALAEVLNREGAVCGECGREPGDPLDDCSACARCIGRYVDALLPVVDAIAEKRARDRAVDELREAVADLHYDIGGEGYADRTVVTLAAVLDRLTTRADALEAE